MKYCKDKDIDRMVHREIKEGAQFQPGRKHGKLLLANGGLLVISKSPSDRRAYLNARTCLRALKDDAKPKERTQFR